MSAYAAAQGLGARALYDARKRLLIRQGVLSRTKRRRPGFERVRVAAPCVAASTRSRIKFSNGVSLELGGEAVDHVAEMRIAQCGLQDKIRLLGFREPDEVLSIVKASDFFVMPSLSEGTPVALLEAAALARPLLASRIGGIPELVADGKEALLVSPGDQTALVAGLARLCDEPEFARNLGTQAQHRIWKEFSVRSQIEATARAYQKAWKHSRERLSK